MPEPCSASASGRGCSPHYSAATVAPFALLVPVVGMAAALLVFGEPLAGG